METDDSSAKPADLLRAQLLYGSDGRQSGEHSFLLGFLSYEGFCVERDYAVALEHFRKAADAGSAWAQHAIGLMYETGRGVEQNIKSAIDWYGRAAKQGHIPASTAMGLIYKYGPDEVRDQKTAVQLFKLAAEAGNSMAALQLGDSFERGLGTDVDEEAARHWYFRAVELPDESTGAAYATLALIYRAGRLGIPVDQQKAEQFAQIGMRLAKERLG